MAPSITGILLWLFVINHGIAFGAGLYETRVMVSPWIGALLRGDAPHLPDSGRKFWALSCGTDDDLRLASLKAFSLLTADFTRG